MNNSKLIIEQLSKEEIEYFNELAKQYEMSLSGLIKASVRKYFWTCPPTKLLDSKDPFDPSPLMEFEKSHLPSSMK